MDALLRLHEKQGETVLGLLKSKKNPSIGFNTLLPFSWQKSPLKKLKKISSVHDVSLYYNCWGADIFSQHDHAPVRIGYIHNHFPNFEKYIQHFAPYLDGFLAVNPATTTCLRTILQRTHHAENIQTITLPISPPEKLSIKKKTPTIGLIGRINFTQKRYDRLPEFADILSNVHPEFQIEVLGDGPAKKPLMATTAELKNLRFIPWKTSIDYWNTISKWQYVLFLSDYEGLPISLLEALHVGCKSIYPDLHDGDQQGLALQLYPQGDMQCAVDRISECLKSNYKHLPSNDIYLKHNEANYFTSIEQALVAIQKNSVRNNLGDRQAHTSKSYNRKYTRLIRIDIKQS